MRTNSWQSLANARSQFSQATLIPMMPTVCYSSARFGTFAITGRRDLTRTPSGTAGAGPTRWEQITPPGDSMFDIQSHRDLMHQFPGIEKRDFESGWLIGKLTAVTVSLKQMDLWVGALPDPETLLCESVETDSVWEAGKAIFEAVEEQHPDECEFVIAAPPVLPAPVLASLTAPQSRTSAVDRLAALLGRSAILISSRDPSARPHVETIVSGLACTLRDSGPIEIIRVFHGPVSDGVSLAVLMPGRWHVQRRLPVVGIPSHLQGQGIGCGKQWSSRKAG